VHILPFDIMELQHSSEHNLINTPITMGPLVSNFLNEKSPSTLTAYQRDLSVFAGFLSTVSVENALSQLFSLDQGKANFLVLRYKAYLKEKGLQPTTINRRLSAIRSIVKLANLVGYISWKIEVQNLMVTPYRDTRGPGKDVFNQMLQSCEGQPPPQGIRNRAVLRLLYDLALRRGEVSRLDIEDLDLNTNRLSILGKGRTQKEIMSLPDLTANALKNWLHCYPGTTGPLFINLSRSRPMNERLSASGIYRIVSKLGDLIGHKVRPHGLRHTAITEACKKIVSHQIGIEELLDFSRHKDIRTLFIYRDRERNVQGLISRLISE
jgi:integrase/recombinase XerC